MSEIESYQFAIKEVLPEIAAEMGGRHKEFRDEKFQQRIIFGLPQLMAGRPDEFNTEWNRPLKEEEINEMRSLAKGIRLKPFNKDELSLIEKRDRFKSNLKALIAEKILIKKRKHE